MQYAAARAVAAIETIVTRDPKGFAAGALPVLAPTEALRRLGYRRGLTSQPLAHLAQHSLPENRWFSYASGPSGRWEILRGLCAAVGSGAAN